MSEHSPPISDGSDRDDSRLPSAVFDYERYRHHLERLDMPDAARRRLGAAVHEIARNIVDRAFGDDPVQLARKVGDRFRTAAQGGAPAVLGSIDHDDIKP